MKEIRVEREWHGGATLVVFETCGDNQITIDVLGGFRTDNPPRDGTTGRNVVHSLCLKDDNGDIAALESFLATRRKQLALNKHDDTYNKECNKGRSYEEAFAAARAAERRIEPGSRVHLDIDLPAAPGIPAVPARTVGKVLRIVHVSIEGEPIKGPDGRSPPPIMAHVMFEGLKFGYPIDITLLRT